MYRDFTYFKDKHTVEGAREIFERICETILQSHHPNDNVKIVKVMQGDGGIDIFVGDYGNEPLIVYQCKYFLDEIGSSQKQQVKNSFLRAVSSKEFEVKEWILCVPKFALETKEHKWLSDWKKEKEKEYPGLQINYMTGSQLIGMARKNDVYNSLFEIQDSNKINDIFETVSNIDKRLNDTDYIKNTLPSHLSRVIKELSNNIEYVSYETEQVPFDIDIKIKHNNLNQHAYLMETYGNYGKVISNTYRTLNEERPKTKEKFYAYIHLQYKKTLGKYIGLYENLDKIDVIRKHADDIIEDVFLSLKKEYINDTPSDLTKEDLETSLHIIIIDAFVECKILENPNKNQYDTTQRHTPQ